MPLIKNISFVSGPIKVYSTHPKNYIFSIGITTIFGARSSTTIQLSNISSINELKTFYLRVDNLKDNPTCEYISDNK